MRSSTPSFAGEHQDGRALAAGADRFADGETVDTGIINVEHN